MRGIFLHMAIRINSSFFKLWGIRRCSVKIAKIVNSANRPAVLYPTSKGLKLVTLYSENSIDLGFKKLSSQLMPPLDVSKESKDLSTFKGQIIQIYPYITGKQLNQCLRSLIKKGLYDSGDLLKKNGVSLRPEIKTTEDLANYLSDRLKNKLFSINGSVDSICDLADSVEVKLNAIKAAILLGKDINGIVGSISADIKNFDSLTMLENSLAEYGVIVDGLAVFPYVKRTGNIEQEKLTIKELTAYISSRLKIDPDETADTTFKIRALLENTEKLVISINDSNAGNKIDSLFEDIAYLRTLLAPVQRSGTKSMQTVNNLVALAVSHLDGPITEDLLNKTFKIEDVNEDRISDWPSTLPQITKEMANKINVLIVDDEPGVRRVLERSFKRLGFWVATADNGELGLEMMKNGGFDIVYSDFNMPRMDGVDFLSALRLNNMFVPACIISASPPELAPKKLSEFINAGNAKYIVKDIDNMTRILRPAIEAAQIKSGVLIDQTGAGSSPTVATSKTSDLDIFRGRLTHKLNNFITGFFGVGQLLAADPDNNTNDIIYLRNELAKFKDMIGALSAYTKESAHRPKGDMELLPNELKNDESTINAIATLRTADDAEYHKIAATTAGLVVLYSPILETLSRELDLFEKNRDKQTIVKINKQIRKLKIVNDALCWEPEKGEASLAVKTIEYILDNLK